MLTSQIMLHDFLPGDFLIFQLESGFALLRVLDVNQTEGVWHLAAYEDLFIDPEAADSALENPEELTVDKPHIALTNRAFESTPVSRMKSAELTKKDLEAYESWKESEEKVVHDRSVRLLLGLR